MGDAEHLVGGAAVAILAGRSARQPPQLLPDDGADAPADALVDLIEDERRRGVGMGKRAFERQHQARCLAARGHARHRLERFAGVGADQKFNLVDASAVEGHAPTIGQIGALWMLTLCDCNAEARPRHLQLSQFLLNLPRQAFACSLTFLAQLGAQFADDAQQSIFLLLQLGSFGFPVAQLLQFTTRLCAESVDLLDRVAIFAFEVSDQL